MNDDQRETGRQQLRDRLGPVADWQQLNPDEAVVLVPIWNAADHVRALLQSAIEAMPAKCLLLLVDDASPDRSISREWPTWEALLPCTTHFIRSEINLGYPTVVDTVMAGITGDLIIVNSDVELTPGWYQRFRSTRGTTADIATVSCFASSGGILSAPNENSALEGAPHGWTVNEYSNLIATESLRNTPNLPVAVGHVWMICRAAYNVVGPVLNSYGDGRGYAEEVDFSLRAARFGFKNVLADDVYVFHHGSASFGQLKDNGKAAADAELAAAYPFHLDRAALMTQDRYGGFCLAKDRTRLIRGSVRLAVDCTCLTGVANGTQRVALNTVVALSRLFPSCTAIVGPQSPKFLKDIFQELGVQSEVVSNQMGDSTLRFDVVYRPFQVYRLEELQWLKRIADRIIVHQLDLLAYHNPFYHHNFEEYARYRDVQRLLFEVADGTAFLSQFVREDALREYPRLSRSPLEVVYLGVECSPVDEILSKVAGRPSRSPLHRIRKHDSIEVSRRDMVISGTGFAHKNRVFAIKLASEMSRFGWDGTLFMTGAYPSAGSSRVDERQLLLTDKIATERVKTLGEVSQQTLDQLFSQAGVLLQPSTAEGFGLPPFEAARFGLPAVAGNTGAFREILPTECMLLGNFDLAESARNVLELLDDATIGNRIVTLVKDRGNDFTWEKSSEAIERLIRRVLEQPRNPVRAVVSERTVVSL